MMVIKVTCPFLKVIYYDNDTKSYPECKHKGYRLTDFDSCFGCDLKELSSSRVKKIHEKDQEDTSKPAAKLTFGKARKPIDDND